MWPKPFCIPSNLRKKKIASKLIQQKLLSLDSLSVVIWLQTCLYIENSSIGLANTYLSSFQWIAKYSSKKMSGILLSLPLHFFSADLFFNLEDIKETYCLLGGIVPGQSRDCKFSWLFNNPEHHFSLPLFYCLRFSTPVIRSGFIFAFGWMHLGLSSSKIVWEVDRSTWADPSAPPSHRKTPSIECAHFEETIFSGNSHRRLCFKNDLDSILNESQLLCL